MLREGGGGDGDGVPQPLKPPETSEASGHGGDEPLPLVTSCAFEKRLGQDKQELDSSSSLKSGHPPTSPNNPWLPSRALAPLLLSLHTPRTWQALP